MAGAELAATGRDRHCPPLAGLPPAGWLCCTWAVGSEWAEAVVPSHRMALRDCHPNHGLRRSARSVRGCTLGARGGTDGTQEPRSRPGASAAAEAAVPVPLGAATAGSRLSNGSESHLCVGRCHLSWSCGGDQTG